MFIYFQFSEFSPSIYLRKNSCKLILVLFINYFFDLYTAVVQITIVPLSRLSIFKNNTKIQYKIQTTAEEPDQSKETITTPPVLTKTSVPVPRSPFRS